MKFTERGGRIELCASLESSGNARVEVSDSGIGMQRNTIPYVFELYVQGQQPVDRIVSGLGVGLALVRTIVEMHGGKVDAHSDGPGRGSRFAVHLPVHRVEKRTSPPVVAEHVYKPKRVLVVDDNVDAASSMAKLLESCGHTVRVAHNGEQAIENALAEPLDAVLLDIALPGMDGYQVAERLRSHPSLNHIRLIALSGFGREDDRQRSLQAGFDAHLTKPADLIALQEAIAVPPKASLGSFSH